ncbi:AhpC/TSA family protein [Mesobacillus maritimus]
MLTQLRDRYQEISATGYQVIIITPSNRSFLEQFDTAFGPYPFPIYGDPARALYREMGHVSMAKTKLLLKAGKALLKGGSKTFLPSDEKQQNLVKKAMKTHDIYIQGGSWLFSESGEVTWSHVDTAPEDHATIDQLLGQMK